MVDFLLVERRLELLVEHALAVRRAVVGREAAIFVVGHVDSVVRHVKVERLFPTDGHFQGLDGLARQCFGEEHAVGVVFLQPVDVETPLTVVPLAEIARRPSVSGSGDVHVKSEVARFGPAGRLGAEVRLPAVDGVVAVVVQQLG